MQGVRSNSAGDLGSHGITEIVRLPDPVFDLGWGLRRSLLRGGSIVTDDDCGNRTVVEPSPYSMADSHH